MGEKAGLRWNNRRKSKQAKGKPAGKVNADFSIINLDNAVSGLYNVRHGWGKQG